MKTQSQNKFYRDRSIGFWLRRLWELDAVREGFIHSWTQREPALESVRFSRENKHHQPPRISHGEKISDRLKTLSQLYKKWLNYIRIYCERSNFEAKIAKTSSCQNQTFMLQYRNGKLNFRKSWEKHKTFFWHDAKRTFGRHERERRWGRFPTVCC